MNLDRYAELLAVARPVFIETPEEHDRMLSIAEGLMEKGAELPPEEEKLLALVVLLIEAFEASIQAGEQEDDEDDDKDVEIPSPHQTLQRLMTARGLSLDDVVDFFGNPHAAREAIEGKRPITRGQAKQLGSFFRVPPKLFHS